MLRNNNFLLRAIILLVLMTAIILLSALFAEGVLCQTSECLSHYECPSNKYCDEVSCIDNEGFPNVYSKCFDCKPNNQPCTENRMCCSGFCVNNKCSASECTTDTNCPTKQYCSGGTCLPCQTTEGANCSRDSMCCANPTPNFKNCDDSHCCPWDLRYWDPSKNECSAKDVTDPPPKHTECSNGQCITINSDGTNQCGTPGSNDDSKCYHKACTVNFLCEKVNGYPDVADSCSNNNQCEAGPSPECTPGACDYINRRHCTDYEVWSAPDSIDYCNNCYSHCSDGVCNCGESYPNCGGCLPACVDNDRDGYGTAGRSGLGMGCRYEGVDCNDDIPMIHPGATESCIGMWDEDCDGKIDCADPDCTNNNACSAGTCTQQSDCNVNDACWDTACSGGKCVYTNPKCVNDGVCCYPMCSYEQEPADCPTCQIPVGGNQTLTLRPISEGVGGLQATILSGTTVTYKYERDLYNLAAWLWNRWSGNDIFGPGTRNCITDNFGRGFMIMDTSCIPANAKIYNATLKFFVGWRSGAHASSIWVDTSDITHYPNSNNSWIIPNPYVNVPVSQPTSVQINSWPVLYHDQVNVNVPIQYIKRGLGNYTRFIMRHGNTSISDWALADGLRDCSKIGTPFDCGPRTACDCSWAGAIGTACRSAPNIDPCYYESNLKSSCSCDVVGAPYPPSTGTHQCNDYRTITSAVTYDSPILEVGVCYPNCTFNCGQSDACGGTCPDDNLGEGYVNNCDKSSVCYDIGQGSDPFRIVPAGYNSCIIGVGLPDSSCDNETICYDGLDNDCDSLVDCEDQNCWMGIENCSNGHDDDCDGLIDCNDPGCNNTCPYCPAAAENCTNSYDDNCNGLTDCSDSECQGYCPDCPAPTENCTNGKDDDCDGGIDGFDTFECPEGSGNTTTSIYRRCDDSVQNDAWNDNPLTLIDEDDDGCCDLCILAGYHYDTTDISSCGTPSCNCGTEQFEWENLAQQEEYCCGDDANEFYKNNPDNPTIVACCNESTHCVDSEGKCQMGSEELFGLCTNGQDDDCDGNIDINDTNCTGTLTGHVYKQGGIIPIAGAIIRGSLPGTPYESQAVTGPDGSYLMQNALVGEYPFIASKPGYDDNVTIIAIVSKATHTQDFSLRNGSCHYDCTDYYGNCNPDCQGLDFGAGETCTFISTICYNRPKGFVASYKDADQKITHEYTCCEGPERTYSTVKATVTGDIENVYDYKFTVLLGGQRRTLHILYWNK